MTNQDKTPDRDDIELMLPWHATGTLSQADARRVEAALSQDDELLRRLDLARDELGETVQLNEALGTPSSRSLETLFAAIDKESPAPKQASAAASWLSGLFAQFSPRTLAWSASAAALLIMLQAGLITGLLLNDHGAAVYETASRNDVPVEQGAFVLVRFNPMASAADVTKFLDANQASVADGPRGGLYRLRVAPGLMAKEDLAKVVTRLSQESGIVTFVVATD